MLPSPLTLHPDRLFPVDPNVRTVARRIHASIKDLPIISPHGHTDPGWFAENDKFPDPASLFIIPDHYVFRMLFSQGVPMEALGIPHADGHPGEHDSRKIWNLFASHYHLFRATPSRMWLDWVFHSVFEIDVRLSEETADRYYDHITEHLNRDEFRPRALFERFNIEVLTTTEGALDRLNHHASLMASEWKGRVTTAYRPDAVVDPDHEGFVKNLELLGDLSGEDTLCWKGYLRAHRNRRAFFKQHGATSSDHGHASALTADLDPHDAQSLFERILRGKGSGRDHETFRGQMLTEMAKMSLDDGLVLQIHPGSFRNHNANIFKTFGRDKGCDIPTRTDYVHNLKPLLDVAGCETGLTVIVFTLDESAYARELAPLAGVYPALKLGPAWWFHDSPEGMRRFRQQTTETAGFYNTVGFNDDTRAFLSIPARHDVARRIDAGFLAELVCDHRLEEDEAFELARDITYRLPKEAYKL